jgi:hypothetical protein
MGLGDFLSGVKDAAVNVGKGAAWAVRPDHWDDIAEGVGKAGEFVVEHPGQAWDTAFEVGRAVVKDQMDPVNLAINAGLIAATVATGGAAAPAFIAKLGLGAKSLEAGLTAAKVGETIAECAKVADTVIEGANAVKTGAQAVEATTSAVRATETAAEAGRAVSTGTKALEAADTAADTARTGSKAMELVDKGLGLQPGKWGTRAQRVLNPLETGEKWGAAAFRERAAGRILEAGGEAPSLARQATAAFVQGGGKGVGMAEQLQGMSDKVYEAQKWAQRAQAVGKRAHQAEQIGRGVEVAADPLSAVEPHVNDYVNSQTHAAGYSDRGQVVESMYGGNSSQVAGPGDDSQLAVGTGSQVAGAMYGSGGSGGVPPVGGGAPGAAPAPGPGSRSSAFTQGTQAAAASANQVTENLYGMDEATSQAASTSRRGMHYWEGPHSQWAGGIKANHDWRPMEPLRPIRTGHGPVTKRQSDGMVDTAVTAAPLNEQGAPANFSPLVPKSGMYSISQGQTPRTGFDDTGQGYLTMDDTKQGKQPSTWDVQSKGLLDPGPTPTSVYDTPSVYDAPAAVTGSRTSRRQTAGQGTLF